MSIAKRKAERVGLALLTSILVLTDVASALAQDQSRQEADELVPGFGLQRFGRLTPGAAWPEGTTWPPSANAPTPRAGTHGLGLSYRTVSAQRDPRAYPSTNTSATAAVPTYSAPTTPGFGNIFFKGWVVITSVEFALMGVCAALPRSFTGWSDHMVDDALNNLRVAYTTAPVWDDDGWAINYVGHPYGGAVYYNTVRCQGATPFQSFLFSTALSFQWEYIVEAVAEPPSTQDLLITSTTGAILGESIHLATLQMKKNGTSILEKALILILNPTSVLFTGFN